MLSMIPAAPKERESAPSTQPLGASLSETERRQRRAQVETFLDLTRIQQLVERRSAGFFAREGLEDVTPPQANVLLVLMQEGRPLTARRLAERLALSEVTIGRFLTHLERHGWIEREPDPRDRRARLVRPTARTRRTLPRFIAVANTLLDQAFVGFAETELTSLGEAVARVSQNLRED